MWEFFTCSLQGMPLVVWILAGLALFLFKSFYGLLLNGGALIVAMIVSLYWLGSEDAQLRAVRLIVMEYSKVTAIVLPGVLSFWWARKMLSIFFRLFSLNKWLAWTGMKAKLASLPILAGVMLGGGAVQEEAQRHLPQAKVKIEKQEESWNPFVWYREWIQKYQ
jgi:hypothetical protein